MTQGGMTQKVVLTAWMFARHPRQVFYGWWVTLAGTGLAAYTDGVGYWGFSNFFAAIVNHFGWSQALAGVGPNNRVSRYREATSRTARFAVIEYSTDWRKCQV